MIALRSRFSLRDVLTIPAVLGMLVTTDGCALAPLRPIQTSTTTAAANPTTPGQPVPVIADSEVPEPGQDLAFHANPTVRQRFQVHIDFGRVFESEGNYDSAVMEYQEALKVFKDRKQGGLKPADEALAHRRIGGALDKLGRFPQAEEHYKQALALDPQNPKIWNDAGYSYYLQGRFAQAQQALLTGNKLAPDDPKIRINLGLTLAAAGKTDDALPLLSETAGDAVGHLNLGYLLAANNHFELARREYETALAMRPDLEIAKRALAQLDRQQFGTGGTSLPPIQVTADPTPRYPSNVDPKLVHASAAAPALRPSLPPAKPTATRPAQPTAQVAIIKPTTPKPAPAPAKPTTPKPTQPAAAKAVAPKPQPTITIPPPVIPKILRQRTTTETAASPPAVVPSSTGLPRS